MPSQFDGVRKYQTYHFNRGVYTLYSHCRSMKSYGLLDIMLCKAGGRFLSQELRLYIAVCVTVLLQWLLLQESIWIWNSAYRHWPQSNGNSVLLCQARGMFPALVRFTWQAEDQHGRKVELRDDEQLEQRDEDQVQITSMLIVEKDKAMNNKFTCSVQHDSSFDDITPRGVFELSHTLYLFSVLYVMLLAKNVVYFCTVSVLLCKRNRASKEMFRSKAKHANKS
ncbi:patr class I histocompatibility antigen, A-108 alpha chain-like isoform X2 [Ictalurus furcatus]|uniref:patr class I histocompatibility antigen, A-108 alpha chain-like isoform X2 n=1 Tax=Ictalurus furcatus TaxID=66913 RepID=UPI00234FE917|nr:patr class I histocompatibility antigen, A-108 alpha chain-like isoform X2 [Ictalurus furcatus]